LRHANVALQEGDAVVYGSLQAMFNAKPDLLICEGNNLFVFEAKFKLGFDAAQLGRTDQIAEVWRELLYEDLGFEQQPDNKRKTIGLAKYGPDISWERIHELAMKWLGPEDFSTRVLSKVLRG
jgi:hypothetical protein